MATSVKLTATSDFATAGKQFIGRATGPDARWGVALEFVGARSGKRQDVTTLTVIDPGLFKIRDTTRKGTSDDWVLIWDLDGSLIRTGLREEDALRLARDLTPAAIATLGRRVEGDDLEEILQESMTLDQGAEVELRAGVAGELGLPSGTAIRRDVVAARRTLLGRIRGVRTPELPVEIGALPSDSLHRRAALEARRSSLREELAQVERELAGTTA